MAMRGSCHCGATQFEVTHEPTELHVCNCSFCHKRGMVRSSYPAADFTLKTARHRASTYQWNRYTMEHHRCAICGCGTYSEGPTWGEQTGRPDWSKHLVNVNARLLDDFDLEGREVRKINGRQF
jgi:hypothetical protein